MFRIFEEAGRNPAVRSYLAGEGFDYLVFAYNAKKNKKEAPDLESQVILYKDDEELTRGSIIPVSLDDVSDYFRIPISRRIFFKDNMEPGQYVLQLTVTDKKAKKKHSIATQAVNFEIRESKN